MKPRIPLQSLLRGQLVTNTASLLVGQGGRVAIQAAYFVLVAQGLGVTSFGAFAAVLALISIISPFSTFGAINLMIRDIAVDSSTSRNSHKTTQIISLIGGALVTAILCGITLIIIPDNLPIWILAAIAVSEIILARLTEVSAAAFQAAQKMQYTAFLQLLPITFRLIAAITLTLVYSGSFTLASWCGAYLLSTLLSTIVALYIARGPFGGGKAELRAYLSRWKEGILFSISLASQSVYNDIDKVMLSKLSSLEANGIYSAAYRLVEVAFAPMRALLGAAYPRFFRHGADGLRSALLFTKKLAIPTLGICLSGSIVLFFGAGYVPLILGSDYAASVSTLQFLAIVPLFRGAQYLAADTLTGSGKQGVRSIIQVSGAIGNVAANLILIPAFGLNGAVLSTIGCEVVLTIALWSTVAWLSRSEVTA